MDYFFEFNQQDMMMDVYSTLPHSAALPCSLAAVIPNARIANERRQRGEAIAEDGAAWAALSSPVSAS